MDNHPKISVVMPVHNGDRYLQCSIESVLSQIETDWELIIVNDCSSDYSLEIIKKCQDIDYRIKTINCLNRVYLPEALNIGFRCAIGQYYTWTSHDNVMKPDCLKVLSEYLDSNPTIGLVYSDYDLIDTNGKLIKIAIKEEPNYIPVRNVVGASFMYRAEVAKRIGSYNSNLYLVEDYDYWVRFYIQSNLFHIPINLYSYRLHKNSLTEVNKFEIRKAVKKYKEKMDTVLYPTIENEKICLAYYLSFRMYGARCKYNDEFKLFIKHPQFIIQYLKMYEQKMKWFLQNYFITRKNSKSVDEK